MNKTQKPLVLDENNFESEVLKSSEPVLVDFWAVWCVPCRAIAPVIEQLAVEFEGTVKVGKVDVDADGELARRYRIGSIPTLVIFSGGEVVDRIQGVTPKEVLAEKLAALAEGKQTVP